MENYSLFNLVNPVSLGSGALPVPPTQNANAEHLVKALNAGNPLGLGALLSSYGIRVNDCMAHCPVANSLCHPLPTTNVANAPPTLTFAEPFSYYKPSTSAENTTAFDTPSRSHVQSSSTAQPTECYSDMSKVDVDAIPWPMELHATIGRLARLRRVAIVHPQPQTPDAAAVAAAQAKKRAKAARRSEEEIYMDEVARAMLTVADLTMHDDAYYNMRYAPKN
ncbi:hypothetical protein NMY22_g15175 [Coprinellus aureogranulatus]|nr:hypothetical protein NMY22_g15175 [Coprinellus aureogranulatus]